MIAVNRILYYADGPGKRHPVTEFAGIIKFYSSPVRTHNDYICAPTIDTFTLEEARVIETQMSGRQNSTTGEFECYRLP